MFIAIIGTRSSGKCTIRDFLVNSKGFTCLRLVSADTTSNFSAPGHDRRSSVASSVPRSSLKAPHDHSTRDMFLDSSSEASVAASSRRRPKHLSFLFLEGEASPLSSPGIKPADLEALTFTSPADLLLFVTRNWRFNFVTLDLETKEIIEMFVKRPFFLLVHVDAPILARFHRSQRNHTLESFVKEDDERVFGVDGGGGLEGLRELVDIRLNNTFETVPLLHTHLNHLDLLDPVHLRPNWDMYFMTLASLASRRSNCMKRRVGAVLVRDRRIVSTGYNGTPRNVKNCNEGGCTRCNGTSTPDEDIYECVCLHAEENALLEAGRERVGAGSVLYCNTCPCLKCTIKIIQTGVREVVYNLEYKVDTESARLFSEAGVQLRRFNPKGKHSLTTADLTDAIELAQDNIKIQ